MHHIDLWRYITGLEVEHAGAQTVDSEREQDEAVLITARLTGDVLVSSVGLDRSAVTNEIQVFGSHGHIALDLYRVDGFRLEGRNQVSGEPAVRLRRAAAAAAKVPSIAAQVAQRRRVHQRLPAPVGGLSRRRAASDPRGRPARHRGAGDGTVTPAMSVVLVTDTIESVEGVLTTFRRQTIANRLELVLAAPPDAPLPEDVGSGFGAGVVLRVNDPFDISAARAECVRAANAPVVAIGETHCLPEPDWCERLLADFDEPDVAIVGSLVLCANPETASPRPRTSWTTGRGRRAPAARARTCQPTTSPSGVTSCWRSATGWPRAST